jgi:hypothetical protein
MACPKCGCKVSYPYGHDAGWDDDFEDTQQERCAACGEVFHIDDHADEDDEEPLA